MWISLNYEVRDLGDEAANYGSSSNGYPGAINWPIDEKMAHFNKRIDEWYLGVAEKVVTTFPEAGFAGLQIVLSYFECISKYYEGFIGDGGSGCHFKKGVLLAFPELTDGSKGIRNAMLNDLYSGARNGLYHVAGAAPYIKVTSLPTGAFHFDEENGQVLIHPLHLVRALREHLKQYVAELKTNEQLRNNFEKRFNYEMLLSPVDQ